MPGSSSEPRREPGTGRLRAGVGQFDAARRGRSPSSCSSAARPAATGTRSCLPPGAAVAEAGYCAAALFGYGFLMDRWPMARPIITVDRGADHGGAGRALPGYPPLSRREGAAADTHRVGSRSHPRVLDGGIQPLGDGELARPAGGAARGRDRTRHVGWAPAFCGLRRGGDRVMVHASDLASAPWPRANPARSCCAARCACSAAGCARPDSMCCSRRSSEYGMTGPERGTS